MQYNTQNDKDSDELLALMRQGDVKAFDEIYARFWNKLFVAAYRVLEDEASCKDIIQDVFLDIWNRRETLKVHHLNAYLFQAVKYQIAKQLRKRPVNPVHLNVIAELQSSTNAEDGLIYDDLSNYLDRAIALLSPRCQKVFRLSRFEYLSNKEIGQRLNISVSTVENQINIALKILRTHINDELILVLLCCFFHE